jgi:hypothetical protein
MGDTNSQLARAFYEAAEQYSQPKKPHPMLEGVDASPQERMARQLCADVLKAIGDVYAANAVLPE